MIIIALDLSASKTGFSIWKSEFGLKKTPTLFASGIITGSAKTKATFNPKGKKVDALLKPNTNTQWWVNFFKEVRPDVIVYEGLHPKFKSAMVSLAQLRGKVLTCAEVGLQSAKYTTRELKIDEWREVVAKQYGITQWPRQRDPAKELAIKVVRKHYKLEPLSDDEAEAILLGEAFIGLGGHL
jgi:hypothetical protein